MLKPISYKVVKDGKNIVVLRTPALEHEEHNEPQRKPRRIHNTYATYPPLQTAAAPFQQQPPVYTTYPPAATDYPAPPPCGNQLFYALLFAPFGLKNSVEAEEPHLRCTEKVRSITAQPAGSPVKKAAVLEGPDQSREEKKAQVVCKPVRGFYFV